MKIVIAPDSFKESLSAMEVASAIEAGWRQIDADAEVLKLPMADGGEGTVQALVAATAGDLVEVEVTAPLGNRVRAGFGLVGDGRTAVVEMAQASGLHLVPRARRNPLLTSTFGTGELILAALDRGVERIIIGIGGSATNDGGAGMMQALGARLLDEQGEELPAGGGALDRLVNLDLSGLDPRLSKLSLEVACDVDNPLCGPKGASAVFGPQKGADEAMVAQLDANLGHYAKVIRRQLGVAVAEIPGAGAAGGLGAALAGLLQARLRPGIEIVMEAVGLERALQGADLVITGEGCIDGQSVHGKTPVGVARLARELGVPVVALAGSLGPGSELVHREGIDALFSVVPGVTSLDQALADGAHNLILTARNLAALWQMAR
ncbi:glycerate kinase [Ferrimonas sediminicola]|uniref:Glycerate kinase n=1 Tax=Ferrimonas sediminicola TaxID=2569538 RepID=A0A4V5NVS7_9GAMM|nr:glycerate kinase [Ferrimonas sediminicola]TKB51611.1 glycerate kinase [Ferrimonas sediminicola]